MNQPAPAPAPANTLTLYVECTIRPGTLRECGNVHRTRITVHDALAIAQQSTCHWGDRWLVIDHTQRMVWVEHSWPVEELTAALAGIGVQGNEWTVMTAARLRH